MFLRLLFSLMFVVSFNCYSTLKDPTRPIDYNHGEFATNDVLPDDKQEMEIQGLFISKSKRVALINNIFFTVGDRTQRGELVAIFKDRVVLKQGEAMHVVFMINQKVRKDK